MQRAAFIVAAVLAALAMVGVVFLAAPPYSSGSSGAVELDSFDDPGTSFNKHPSLPPQPCPLGKGPT